LPRGLLTWKRAKPQRIPPQILVAFLEQLGNRICKQPGIGPIAAAKVTTSTATLTLQGVDEGENRIERPERVNNTPREGLINKKSFLGQLKQKTKKGLGTARKRSRFGSEGKSRSGDRNLRERGYRDKGGAAGKITENGGTAQECMNKKTIRGRKRPKTHSSRNLPKGKITLHLVKKGIEHEGKGPVEPQPLKGGGTKRGVKRKGVLHQRVFYKGKKILKRRKAK